MTECLTLQPDWKSSISNQKSKDWNPIVSSEFLFTECKFWTMMILFTFNFLSNGVKEFFLRMQNIELYYDWRLKKNLNGIANCLQHLEKRKLLHENLIPK